jgi:outer membrane cobalamin receptor
MRASYAILYIFQWFLALPIMAQSTVLFTGKVIDEHKQPLAGVVISEIQGKPIAVTDIEGNYTLQLNPQQKYPIRFSYIGYEILIQEVDPDQSSPFITELKPISNQLNQVVISAGKYNQEIKRVTVSTDMIKPYLWEHKAVLNMEGIMNQLPGVNVVDGQANIRGGSGWTYGAGSRVLVMVDDIPFTTGDANQVQWKFLPTENIGQMEVIKGASSVLYGSSALNGVINIRTAKPQATPKTSFTLISGVYNKLKRDSTRWNPEAQFQYGFNAYDSRKIKHLDLVTGINYVKDEGYRLGEKDERFRATVNANYHHPKIAGWEYGVDASAMRTDAQSFLLWEGWSYAYTALDSQTTNSRSTNISINPHTTFYGLGFKHSFRGRLAQTTNDIGTQANGVNQDNSSKMVYGDYQLQKTLPQQWGVITGGLAANYVKGEAALFNGTHSTHNIAPYLQADLHYKRWSLSAGVRHERFSMDQRNENKTIYRGGLSYEMTRSTFIRSSYGQGYRFPSIAERYITTSSGSVNVFANPNLQSETGWNAEIGIRQGIKVGTWTGLVDIAYFHTEYQNMVEFNFGQWRPIDFTNIFKSFGFTSVNIGSTRINGVDASLTGSGKIGVFTLKSLIGYTYMNPVSLTPDKPFVTDSSGTSYTYKNTSSDTSTHTLKYRYNHLAKADLELGYQKWSIGFSTRYNSYMKNTDLIFDIIIPGVKQARSVHTDGDWIFDARLSYQATNRLRINMLVNNITNHEQMTRPADMRPPRLFILQVNYVF